MWMRMRVWNCVQGAINIGIYLQLWVSTLAYQTFSLNKENKYKEESRLNYYWQPQSKFKEKIPKSNLKRKWNFGLWAVSKIFYGSP